MNSMRLKFSIVLSVSVLALTVVACSSGGGEDETPDTVCTPLCEGIECGDDGCGGECGVCPNDKPICHKGGCIEECIPVCEGKECGDDSCGGQCGECPDVAPFCVDGKCDLECKPSCQGKECGSDGCGGLCGTCPDAASDCQEGKCVTDCIPDCTDKECGSDGCEDDCGECGDDEHCEDGQCLPDCIPDCEDLECGDDGCGDVCGNCPEVAPECVEGKCEIECDPDCEDKECGSDGCDGQCGECEDDSLCNSDGLCECIDLGCGEMCCLEGDVCVDDECCTPDCSGKECGSDGCLEECGECGELQVCTDAGLCQCEFAGCGALCCPEGVPCYDGTCCEADCEGKNCGEDGCGGSCGLCDDANLCTMDACFAGTCVYEGMLCDDGNPCTADACDPDVGECVGDPAPMDGTLCDDGNPCTGADMCLDGSCAGEMLPPEELGELDCVCASAADCALIEDGDLCNGTLFCDLDQEPATCLVDPDSIIDVNAGDCDDSLDCTDDECDPAEGCVHLPVDSVCDDGNVCTEDLCDVEEGCIAIPADGPCDDGSMCTQDDACVEGECIGAAKDCSDGLFCNGEEACDPDTGACMEGVAPSIDDGVKCTEDSCDEDEDVVLHVPHNSLCDDDDGCTTDACNPEDGCHYTTAPDGATCQPENACIEDATCEAGECVGGDVKICVDDNPCTHDACDPDIGCTFEPDKNGICLDGNPCNGAEVCVDGECVIGEPPTCDDDSACTVDSCEEGIGCVNTPVDDGTPCSDDDECTSGDLCDTGACVSGALITCEDDSECTEDSCDAAQGCVFAPLENGTLCDDGDECTLNDHCADGTCVAPGELDCADANPCTDESCDPDTGCVTVPNDENQCIDDDVCNGDESCVDGVCAAGDPLVCDDDNECTASLCDAEAGCVSQFVEDGTECGELDGWTCQNGVCTCPPQCDGKECGDDGCGGFCGDCGDGSCNEELFICVPAGQVLVEGGSFLMGSPEDEACRKAWEGPQHKVAITRSLLVSDHEVTQDEWVQVTGAPNPAHFGPGGAEGTCATGDCPLERVSFYEALTYCNMMSEAGGLDSCYTLDNCQGTLGGGCGVEGDCDGDYVCGSVTFAGLDCTGYRLPTEAEWEYLARAGTTTAFAYPTPDGGDKAAGCGCIEEANLDPYGWYCDNSEDHPHAVKGKEPNAWNLYDMAGNVWEWCWDQYEVDYYYVSPNADPLGGAGANRIARSGSWLQSSRYTRSASRSHSSPDKRASWVGFRVVRSIIP